MKKEIHEVMESYTLAEHTHRFAVWAAARASTRKAEKGVVNFERVRLALESIKIEDCLAEFNKNPIDFDAFHVILCNDLCKQFEEKISFGRCAKILAIYIKVTYVIPYPDTDLARFAHPPVDRILLTALKKRGCTFNRIDWTNFTQEDYSHVIQEIRKIQMGFDFWKVEACWNAH